VAGVVGVEFEAARQFMDSKTRLRERADILFQFLAPELEKTDMRYYLVFDELDEDYTTRSTEADRGRYLDLIVSLFKAVREIRSAGSDYVLQNVFPIVLLRDDIFGLLQYNDRAKWTDDTVRIEWSTPRLKEMLAHRLCKAAGRPTMTFAQIWSELTGNAPTYTNRDKFELIESYTMRRPRDFIYYLAEASRRICLKFETGQSRNLRLSGDVLGSCIQDFAVHLRLELEDEISGQLPYVREVVDIVLTMPAPRFRIKDFSAVYDDAARQRGWPSSATAVLDLLYSFSVIGIRRGPKEYFRYLEPDTMFDARHPMLIHKGLLAARRAV
jgi:hypothetical protein